MFGGSFTIMIVFLAVLGVISSTISTYIYRRSIVRNFVRAVSILAIASAAFGIYVGLNGWSHLFWAVPTVIIMCWVIYFYMKYIIGSYISVISEKINCLASGNVRISFTETKKKNELTDILKLVEKLTGSLSTIADFAENIGEENLDVDYDLLGDDDHLGKSMIQMRDNLRLAEQEKKIQQVKEQNQNWVTSGLAKFSDLLRSKNDNMEELTHSIISNLVRYVNANQGGIFIINDDDSAHPVLELKACYAYERRKYLKKTINPGEGLVGTCFLERQSIYMTDIPQSYIRITDRKSVV